METQGIETKPAELLGVIVLLDGPEKGAAQSRVFRDRWTPDQRDRAVRELQKLADDFAGEGG